MSDPITDRIRACLRKVESDEGVKLLYACESGSRGWGFASADSDYDVRFIYIRPRSWYLSIDLERRSDVIELSSDGVLDVAGWDLRKALQLFRRSNPPLMEWLQSPIIYHESGAAIARMRELLPTYYSPQASMHHYLHMAQGNYRDYLKGEQVQLKKYLYVLRPMLAVRWLWERRGPVPMEFRMLMERIVESAEVRKAINDLLDAKRSGAELGLGPRIPAISDFIAAEMARMESIRALEGEHTPAPVEELNKLFRAALEEAWNQP